MPTHRKARPDPDLPSPGELVVEMSRLSRELDGALGELYERSQRYAEAENEYRVARAKHQLQAGDKLQEAPYRIAKPTVDEKSAWVDSQTARERLEAHLQEGMTNAAREAVRARRSQLSALQSAAAAVRAEIEFHRTRPQ